MKCWSLIDLSTKEHGKRSEEGGMNERDGEERRREKGL